MNLHIFICRLETALYLTVWAAQYVDFIVLAGIIASEAAAHQPIPSHTIPSHPIPSNPISTRLFSSQTGFGPWPETDRAGISGWIYVYIYIKIYTGTGTWPLFGCCSFGFGLLEWRIGNLLHLPRVTTEY